MTGKIERWINKPKDGNNGTAVLDLDNFVCPLPVEMMDIKNESDIDITKDHKFDFCFFCHEFVGAFKNEEEFHKSKDNKSMSTESIIPMGTFPDCPEPLSFINSIVDEVVELRSNDSPKYYCALLHCKLCGSVLDVVVYFPTKEDMIKANIQKGDILSRVFYTECYLED